MIPRVSLDLSYQLNQAKNGTCFWKPPPRNSGYRKVGLCSVGQKGEGQVCSCGVCYVNVTTSGSGSCGKSKKCKGECLARDQSPQGDGWVKRGWCNK